MVNQIAFSKILRGNAPRTFPVNFRCKPFLNLYSGETEQVITSGSFLLNPTGIKAKPLISITGSGDIMLLVGTQIIEGDEAGLDDLYPAVMRRVGTSILLYALERVLARRFLKFHVRMLS